MFTILDGRKHFYQWDIDRKLIVADKSIEEVHFSNRADGEALICATYLQGDVLLVDVPNILLQDNWRISAYAYDENHTRFEETYDVKRRSKPADYVYTETEIKNYDDLAQRIEQIEENGISDEAVENAVEKYLEENDIKVDLTGYATEQYVQEQIGNIDIPEVDLSDYAKKSEIPSTEGLASESYVQEQIENIPEPVDEVHVGADAPTDKNVKIWVDTDAESPVATKEYVQQKIAEAQMDGADVDLSAYYTKTETDNAIEQAVGAIEHPTVDLSEYAKKSEIPSTTGLATEQYVQDEIAKIEIPEQTPVDLSDYYTKTEVDEKIGAIEIPEGGSDVDLSDYYTKSEVDEKIAAIEVGGDTEQLVLVNRENWTTGASVSATDEEKEAWAQVEDGDTIHYEITDVATGTIYSGEATASVDAYISVTFEEEALTEFVLSSGLIGFEATFATANVYMYKSTAATVDLSNYYTKEETYSKTEVDALIPDVSGYQTADEVQSAITSALSAIGVAEEGAY